MQGGGNWIIVVRQVRLGLTIPILQMRGRPRKGLIQMTKVAGVGSTRFQTLIHRGHIDLMTSNGLHQTVGRMRHVAVVAIAAGGLQ